jgi:hypothetical protein
MVTLDVYGRGLAVEGMGRHASGNHVGGVPSGLGAVSVPFQRFLCGA